MSHFTVMVITDQEPDDDLINKALAPYHEYECTGHNDNYVQDVDITEEVMREYANQADNPNNSFEKILEDYGLHDKIVSDASEADVQGNGEHRYGYAVIKDGKLIKVINRTNPNSKWDWYVVGGRWAGMLLHKSGLRVDFLKKADLDISKMQDEEEAGALRDYDAVHKIINGREVPIWKDLIKYHDIDVARKLYNENEVIKEVTQALGPFASAEGYLIPRSEYTSNARKSVVLTHAVIFNNQWLEAGEMGWFGSMHNKDEKWLESFNKIFAHIPEESYVTIVDCHV